MNYKLIPASLLLLLCPAVSGYLYEIKVLRKWHPQYNRYHYFIGCCDFHDKAHVENEPQRKKIEELLTNADIQDVHVNVEDLSSSRGNGLIAGSFYINSTTGVLANLGNFCANNNISYDNAEYRYCRVAALGPIINNLQVNPVNFPSSSKITIGMLKKEIEKTIKDLSYKINPSNKPFMQEYIAQVKFIKTVMDKLQLGMYESLGVAEYMNRVTTQLNRLDVIKHLLTFDGPLVGFNLVYSVEKNFNKQKNIAFAGGTHINEAFDMLQKVAGWEKVSQSTVSIFKERDLKKCLGSNIVNGAYCVKPNPVSLALLEHYLNN